MKESARLYLTLQWLSFLMLVVGFAGPWQYGTLGKTQDFGWQPVWALLLNFLGLNLFIICSVANCFSYLELSYRQGKKILREALKWVGAFLFLLVAVPLLAWLPFNQTQRSATPLFSETTYGWGIWVALVALLVQVGALRLRIIKEKKNH
ncbi:hypothetical protein [Candidatus Chlorohelix sp.]|uniref:hypothetical protein n=1 Tax=Candidatus Chlorohelix sp. TaxID=3139201 RepID=UPI00302B003D